MSERCGGEIAIANFRKAWDAYYVSRGFGWHTNPQVYVCAFERIRK